MKIFYLLIWIVFLNSFLFSNEKNCQKEIFEIFEFKKKIIILEEENSIQKEKIKFLQEKIKILETQDLNTSKKTQVFFDPFFTINGGVSFLKKEPDPFIGLGIGIIFRSGIW